MSLHHGNEVARRVRAAWTGMRRTARRLLVAAVYRWHVSCDACDDATIGPFRTQDAALAAARAAGWDVQQVRFQVRPYAMCAACADRAADAPPDEAPL